MNPTTDVIMRTATRFKQAGSSADRDCKGNVRLGEPLPGGQRWVPINDLGLLEFAGVDVKAFANGREHPLPDVKVRIGKVNGNYRVVGVETAIKLDTLIEDDEDDQGDVLVSIFREGDRVQAAADIHAAGDTIPVGARGTVKRVGLGQIGVSFDAFANQTIVEVSDETVELLTASDVQAEQDVQIATLKASFESQIDTIQQKHDTLQAEYDRLKDAHRRLAETSVEMAKTNVETAQRAKAAEEALRALSTADAYSVEWFKSTQDAQDRLARVLNARHAAGARLHTVREYDGLLLAIFVKDAPKPTPQPEMKVQAEAPANGHHTEPVTVPQMRETLGVAPVTIIQTGDMRAIYTSGAIHVFDDWIEAAGIGRDEPETVIARMNAENDQKTLAFMQQFRSSPVVHTPLLESEATS